MKIQVIRKEIKLFKQIDLYENTNTGLTFEQYQTAKSEHKEVCKKLKALNTDMSNRHYSYL